MEKQAKFTNSVRPVAVATLLDRVLSAEKDRVRRLGSDSIPDMGKLQSEAAHAWPALQAAWGVFRSNRSKLPSGRTRPSALRRWGEDLFDAFGFRLHSFESEITAGSGAVRVWNAQSIADSAVGAGLPSASVAAAIVPSLDPPESGASLVWMERLLESRSELDAGILTDGTQWIWVFRHGLGNAGNRIAIDIESVFERRSLPDFCLLTRICSARGSWRALADNVPVEPRAGELRRVNASVSGRLSDVGYVRTTPVMALDSGAGPAIAEGRVRDAWNRLFELWISGSREESRGASSGSSVAPPSGSVPAPRQLLEILGLTGGMIPVPAAGRLPRDVWSVEREGDVSNRAGVSAGPTVELGIVDGVRVVLAHVLPRRSRLSDLLEHWEAVEPGDGRGLATDGAVVLLTAPVPGLGMRVQCQYELADVVRDGRFDVFGRMLAQIGGLRELPQVREELAMERKIAKLPGRNPVFEPVSRSLSSLSLPDSEPVGRPKRADGGTADAALVDKFAELFRQVQAKSERDRVLFEGLFDQLRHVEQLLAKTAARDTTDIKSMRLALREMLAEELGDRAWVAGLRRPHPRPESDDPSRRQDRIRPDSFFDRGVSAAIGEPVGGAFSARSEFAEGPGGAGPRVLPTRDVELPLPSNLLPLVVGDADQLWGIPFGALGMLQVRLARDYEAALRSMGDGGVLRESLPPSNVVMVWLGSDAERVALEEWCAKVSMSRLGVRGFPVLGGGWVMIARGTPRVDEIVEALLAQSEPVGLTELSTWIRSKPSVQALSNTLSRLDFLGGGSKMPRSVSVDRDPMGKSTASSRGYELRLGRLPSADRERFLGALAPVADSPELRTVVFRSGFHREAMEIGLSDPGVAIRIEGAADRGGLARAIAAGQGLRSRLDPSWRR